jgi:soluble lytic murein transglycosylase-like protein
LDIKSLTDFLQLSMMKTLTIDGSDNSDSTDDQSGDEFGTMLQGMLQQMTAGTSAAQTTPEWIQNNPVATIDANSQTDSSTIDSQNTGSDIDTAIKAAAAKYGVDESLIKAVIKQESGFNPTAVSKAGAEGLMQLMPSTAKSLGVDNPFDALQNIDGGTKYIKNLLDSFKGSKELALSAYNGGISRMNNRGVDTVDEINKMPNETQNYVAKVMKAYDNYKKG